MLIRLGLFNTQKGIKRKPLLFFNLIPDIVFGIFIGFFFHLMLIAGILIATTLGRTEFKLLFYSGLGFIVFLISFLIYRNKFFHLLKVPSYKSFLISRNKLIMWVWWTINAWLLTCWAAMVLLGTFNGFGWMHPTTKHLHVLMDDKDLTKTTGVILWVIHCLLLGVLSVSYKKFIEFFRYAQQQLRKRRVQLKQFKLKAEEEINIENLAI
ncbi:hypothetical protein [Mycoplasma parvum]|uniref:Uncharacterized protein n=1 Tax=Mycoplasma parvum str. Indiana TaxID=1403316 RepID=U5NCG0_9MOLU|nr:hypothetical protein [Mycoplasma parvum]AGX89010.1 hypothetical protein PRV_01240 [Mycoplasma parvum str. Indiana]